MRSVSGNDFKLYLRDWRAYLALVGTIFTVGAYGQTILSKIDTADEKAKAALIKADKIDRIEKMVQRLGDKLGISFDDIR